ncbi:MAG: tetratricopeptide repeat protein, partial [Planctomycetes bacterium]|nr:tetratricopeptide repeat protein [Planctomycetota bacterium]
MKRATTCLLLASVLLPSLAAPSLALGGGEADLGEARRLLLSGKYAEAAEIYERHPAKNPQATLGLARSLAAEGKYEEAARALTSVAGEHADVHAELARLAFERGRHEEAETHVDAAIRLEADQLLARWIRGELCRTSGRMKEAEAAYLWLIRFYNEHESEIDEAESLRWIGLAAARYARWKRLGDQFHFLVGQLYPDALKLEADYWPARYQSALLFLEKHNEADTAKQLDAALELNANAAEVHVAVARLALANRRIERAEASLERALEINPRLPAAWMVKADLAWANFQPLEAIRLLEEEVLPPNPVSEAALGRLAAGYVLVDGLPDEPAETRFTRLVDRVTARNEHAGEFFFQLGAWLEERHRNVEAEGFYREAIRRMPQLVGPKARLGMMAMDSGAEAQARGLLEEAFQADPFNVRVDNMLKVLDLVDAMATGTSETCTLKYDGASDALLARYVSRHLDAVYPELCRRFGYRPTERPLVEVFNRAKGIGGHEWFSTRLIGVPYLGTVAASTGKIVGMVSPTDPGFPAKWNWAQTLTHELVHVITLQQTHFNVPHWYTEGLAVWCEGCPRPQKWNQLLLERVPDGNLFDLESINFGFTRPNSSDDWHVAYCQAELYVEYLLEGRSPEVLKELLAAYGENLTTSQAIRRVLGVSREEFERGYGEYLKKTVAELSGMESPRSESFADLLEAYADQPQDADLSARVAYGYLRRGALEEALDAADRALKLDRKHQLAGYVLARLSLQAGKTQEAVELLETSLDRDAPE